MDLWTIGWAGQGAYAALFAGDATSPLFSDPSSGPGGVFAAWGAGVDDLFLVDRQGLVRYHVSLVARDLRKEKHRRAVASWVRTLLLE